MLDPEILDFPKVESDLSGRKMLSLLMKNEYL